MKKALAVILSIVTVLASVMIFSSCKNKENDPTDSAAPSGAATTAGTETGSDLDYIKSKGKLVIGVTEFAPMDYKKEGSEEWIGFDADLAKAFAKSLGVEVKFIPIDWDYKVAELNNKSIDCVWNGMTLTEEVTAAMSCSDAYCNNAQVVIVPADKADSYKTAEDCKSLQFAVEAGSAGKQAAEANGFTFTEVVDQATALSEVAAGTADAAIIDSLMAAAMVGEGTSYASLTYTVSLTTEEYGVGFRQGSDLTAALNEFFAASKADGSMEKAAETYGVQAALIK